MNKKWLKYLLFIGVALIISIGLKYYFINGKYTAKVNGVYITKEYLDKRTAGVIKYYENKARELTEGERKNIREEVTDRLVYEEIVRQETKKRSITVTDKQIKDFVEDKKKRLGGKHFKEYLADQSHDSEKDYMDSVAFRLLEKALIEEVTKGISDPLAKKQAYDKFISELKNKASIRTY